MEQTTLGQDNPSFKEADYVLINGAIDRFTFRNPSNGFVIAQLRIDQDDKRVQSLPGMMERSAKIAVIGTFPSSVDVGTYVVVRGRWEIHPKFGKQLRAFSVTETKPTTVETIEAYLSSPSVRGIGPQLAERIVKHFGEDTLNIIDTDPQRLLEVPGIKRKKLNEILLHWKEQKNQREVNIFFQNYGVSFSLAKRIYEEFAEHTIEVVKSNPYILARTVRGIGFLTADRIAMSLGLSKNSPERLEAGMRYTLETAMEDGHTFLLEEELIQRSNRLLEADVTEEKEAFISALVKKGLVIRNDTKIYLPSMFVAEKRLSSNLAKRILHGSLFLNKIAPETIEAVLSAPLTAVNNTDKEGELCLTHNYLSEEQIQAVKLVAESPLVVITGGPGCGKTTVIRALVNLFQRAGLILKLAAPTGRAAQRMAEVTGADASTIHRMLKYDPYERAFYHCAKHPLELDVLIVDESSMIDLELASSLFDALEKHVRVIVVGDADQLPSVGPGLFLWDLLNVKEVPRVCLSKLFRRAEESAITHIAHDINNNQVPVIPDSNSGANSDAFFVSADNPEDAATKIEQLFVDLLPRRFGFSHSDITVLSPMNKGELGILALNKRLQSRLVPDTAEVHKLQVGDLEFRLGDRVCHRVNNYQLGGAGVFNGDQGRIIGVDLPNRALFVELWDGREIQYQGEDLAQLDLAYAITVHRSQGSEIPAVILALHDSHSILLERQLVYTAITRAKSMLVIVGTRNAIALATRRNRGRKRNSTLCEMIQGEMIQGEMIQKQL